MSSGPTGPVDDGAVAASGATAPCAEPDQQEQGESRYATATADSDPRGEEQQQPAAGTEAHASPVTARGTDEPAAADEEDDDVPEAGSVSDDDDDNDDERSSGASGPGTVAIISYVAVVESSPHSMAKDVGKVTVRCKALCEISRPIFPRGVWSRLYAV